MSYQDVKDKLYHGHRKVANNTNLLLAGVSAEAQDRPEMLYSECIVMYLHGNKVARFHPDYIELYSAGWYTTTTKNRLNLALELTGLRSYIYQRDYQWYYHSHHYGAGIEFKDGMKINYGGTIAQQAPPI